jgi:hypothetical protein
MAFIIRCLSDWQLIYLIMDWQIIIVEIIVAGASAYTLYKLFRFVKNPFNKCDGCSSNCGGCSLDELKKQIEQRKRRDAEA